MTSRSGVFVAYNLARPLAKAGQVDVGRLNRALGLALSKPERQAATFMVYGTTKHFCKCADAQHRAPPCKHMLAKQLLELAS